MDNITMPSMAVTAGNSSFIGTKFLYGVLSTSNVLITIGLFGLLYLMHKDYKTFIALGPGGVPYNFLGYLYITSYRPFCLKNTKARPSPLPFHILPYLTSLDPRAGPRPTVLGIIPHRQINQQAPEHIFTLLNATLDNLANRYPHLLEMKTSCFESHSRGLFSKKPLQHKGHTTCGGEICHMHSVDGSMHLTLHPDDAARVIDAGWGERHPLAVGWHGYGKFLNESFVLVYAPRNEDEVKTVVEIVKAAMGWVSGEVALHDEENNVKGLVKQGPCFEGKGEVEI